jgi:hypothetical protein
VKRAHLARIAALGGRTRWAQAAPQAERAAAKAEVEQVREITALEAALAQARTALELAVTLAPASLTRRLRRMLDTLEA